MPAAPQAWASARSCPFGQVGAATDGCGWVESMEIGIGIPNCVKGTTGAQLLDWSRRADHAGFSSIATIGAVSYPSYEELTLFAAAGR